eukprot:445513_1
MYCGYKYRNKKFHLWYINPSYSPLYPPLYHSSGLLGLHSIASHGLLALIGGDIIDINMNMMLLLSNSNHFLSACVLHIFVFFYDFFVCNMFLTFIYIYIYWCSL